MKLTKILTYSLIVLFNAIFLDSFAQGAQLTLKIKNATLKETIDKIEKNSDYIFIYYDNILDVNREVSLNVEKKSIEYILDEMFAFTNNTYTIIDHQIVISLKNQLEIQNDSSSAIKENVQQISITGIVADREGNPLPGVNIVEKNTTNGVLSAPDGKYAINVASRNSLLVFSFIGFTQKEIIVGNLTKIDITLFENVINLEEVVVVGYGVQKKESLVGSITTVQPAELGKSSVANLTNMLAGRVSGLFTVMNSGQPGADASTILIRGQSTFNSNEPLILIDDLERETAVYGVRGANGVIILKTKRGQIGKAVLTLTSQSSFSSPTSMPDFLGSYDQALLYNEASSNDGLPEKYNDSDLEHYRLGDAPFTHPDNDYYKDFLKADAFQQNLKINIKGGTDVLTYYISGTYLDQGSLLKTFDNGKYDTDIRYQRINFQSNVDFLVSEKMRVSLDMTGRIEIRRSPRNVNTTGSALFDIFATTPPNAFPYYTPDGSFGVVANADYLNPMALMTRYGNLKNTKNVLDGVLRASYDLGFVTKGLDIKALLGVSSYISNSRSIVDVPRLKEYDRWGQTTGIQDEGFISYNIGGRDNFVRMNPNISLNYNRTFLNNHNVTGLLLYTQTKNYSGKSGVEEPWLPTGYQGIVARLTYAYNNKYLFEFNGGYNGSSQFDKKHRYGFFPAMSLGWVLSREKFMEDIKSVDFLKIRGSYGEVGNDKIGDYKYLYLYRYLSGSAYSFGTTHYSLSGIQEGPLGNNIVTWERARKLNVGMDLTMFKDRLTGTFDIFNEKRSDILRYYQTIPAVLGNSVNPDNIASVTNRGFEISLGWIQRNRERNLEWRINGNVSYAKNRIDYIDEVGKVYEWQRTIGNSLGQYYGLEYIGLYQNEDFQTGGNGILELKEGIPVPVWGDVIPGDLKYKDRNDDGVINVFDEGKIGKQNVPTLMYGLTFGGTWRFLDITILFQGAGGSEYKLSGDKAYEFYQNGRVYDIHLGRYNPVDPSTWGNATYPALHTSQNLNNQRSSTFWLQNSSYLRLKNIEIGFTLPKSISSKLGMSNLRFYVNGDNLITWTSMENFDPELTQWYPIMKNVNLGIRMTY
ncbi:MAG: TonB-dependent receptor [Bacteroidia bacterium]|nr:TonB-dependent receptor [Bacteroidia bacterium]